MTTDYGNPNDFYKDDGRFDCVVIVNHIEQKSAKFGDKEKLKKFVLELEDILYQTLKSKNMVLATASAFYFCDYVDAIKLLDAY